MCLTTSAGAIPPNKLGVTEPISPWVRQARIIGDDFNWNVPDPSFLEIRAGFTKVLKARIVNQAEMPNVTIPLDEADPEAQNRLRGNAAGGATSLSSGVYTGYAFIYKPGVFVNGKVLLVGSSLINATERQVYAPNAYVTFKNVDDPQYERIDVIISMGVDASGAAAYFQDWA
jgi:hypothetical protein